MTPGRESGQLPPARKRFAQHFLCDPRILRRIADALAPDRSSTVVEIGPGRGALTAILAERAGTVIAIEVDRDLAAFLRAGYAGSNVRVVEGDALRLDWAALARGTILLAGNLPYNLTTPLLFKALEPPLPDRAVFLVQREVADRIAATEGGKQYGALSVNVQVSTIPEVIGRVPPGAFRPRPAVDSTIIRLTPREPPMLEGHEDRAFRAFVQAVFGMRRKQLQRVLRELDRVSASRASEVLDAAHILPAARPETVSPSAFVALFRARAKG